MKEIQVYKPEVLDALKAIDNVKKVFEAIATVEKAGKKPFYGENNTPIDEQVKDIWRGFAFGKWKELKSEGLEKLVHNDLPIDK